MRSCLLAFSGRSMMPLSTSLRNRACNDKKVFPISIRCGKITENYGDEQRDGGVWGKIGVRFTRNDMDRKEKVFYWEIPKGTPSFYWYAIGMCKRICVCTRWVHPPGRGPYQITRDREGDHVTREQIDLLDALAAEHLGRMAQLTFYRVDNADLANDLVQEALLTACLKIDEVYYHENPVGWLYKTLDFLTKREMRKAYHKAEIPLIEDVPSKNNTTDLPMENYLPQGLTEQERTLLLLRIKEDRSFDEIAQMRGITPTTCRKQLSRAVEKCRRLMREDLAENFFR